MSYQVLARKWRPASFADMVGQDHVLRALANALDRDRLHHAYLFTGTRGVGKTTVARILAKCLNCEQGVSSRPCGTCSSCVEISEGRSVDLLEVDAASRTRIDDTRELLDNVQYAPTRSRFKVYLIDEVHMLSSHSFNALLKTLEEPPPHVKFLLATTDPQKLPATVLSRCLQFNLKNMPAGQVVSHLKTVLDAESVPYDEPSLWLLGRAAAGSMRDGLSLTDQAIAFGAGKLTEAEVRDMLGTVNRQHLFGLLDALADDDAAAVLAAVAAMEMQSVDFPGSVEELLAVLHRLAVIQAVPEALDPEIGDVERLRNLAARFSAEDVQLFYQMALNGRRDIAFAPDGRSGFEMIALRMLAFRPAPAFDLVPAGTAPGPGDSDAGEVGPGAKKSDARRASAAPEVALSPMQDALVPPVEASKAVETPDETHETTAPEEKRAGVAPAAEQGSLATPWHELVEQLGLTGSTQAIVRNCEWRGLRGGELLLVLDPEQSSLFNERHAERIARALNGVMGNEWRVKVEPGELLGETPARRIQRMQEEAHAAALRDLHRDPRLTGFLERFDAVLEEELVQIAADSAARIGEN